MRHIAIESGAFVVSVPQYIPRAAFPADFPVAPARSRVFGNGGAAIVEPGVGEIIAGPAYGEETILYADCDLRREPRRQALVRRHRALQPVGRARSLSVRPSRGRRPAAPACP